MWSASSNSGHFKSGHRSPATPRTSGCAPSSVISPPSALQHSTPGFHESSAHPREPSSFKQEVLDAYLAVSPPHLRIMLLLCHDCALRANTAAKVEPGTL